MKLGPRRRLTNGDPWSVSDDYATAFMAYEAGFCEREALECRNRGCDEYVIDHYKRRAELLRLAIAALQTIEFVAERAAEVVG